MTSKRLWHRLVAAWNRTDSLFECLKPAAFLERPIALRYPIAFYVGHLPAFASNMLLDELLGRDTRQPDLDRLFAFGIDPDEDDAHQELALPELSSILEYRDSVREALTEAADSILHHVEDRVDRTGKNRLELVIEHEVMHHETLLYLFQELPFERKQPVDFDRVRLGPEARTRSRVTIGAGPVQLGTELGMRPFVWDNELGMSTADLSAFDIDRLPVSIGEYTEFIDEGGYTNPALWSESGWAWARKHGLERPKDWSRTDDGTVVRALFRAYPLEEVRGWPVCVSWAEADAYARWRGGRLPTEAELARAAYTTPGGESREYPWGDVPIDADGFDFRTCSPLPIGSTPETDSAWGVAELVGNGWEWTSSLFEPFEGFRAYIEAYPGYSTDFFDGHHYVVFGGSWATDARLLRRSFRNWYRFNYPFPFTKFRVARDA